MMLISYYLSNYLLKTYYLIEIYLFIFFLIQFTHTKKYYEYQVIKKKNKNKKLRTRIEKKK